MLIFDRNYKVTAHTLVDDLARLFKFRGLDDNKVENQYFLCCPFHSGGQEKTASANFSLKDNPRRSTLEGDFWCFGCKSGGHISSILVKLFGDRVLAQNWVNQHYGNLKGLVEEKRELRKIELEKPNEDEETFQVFELDEQAYLTETTYYEKRGITDEMVKRFELGYLPDSKSIYIPVFNAAKEVVFYQTRNIKAKKFYLPKGAKKVLWAGNEVTSGEVYVCESIFNALTLWKFGYQAVAIFGTGDSGIYEQLLGLPSRSFVVALDPDNAGRLGTKELVKFLKENLRLTSVLTIDEPTKDLNDFAKLTKEEFDLKMKTWTRRFG